MKQQRGPKKPQKKPKSSVAKQKQHNPYQNMDLTNETAFVIGNGKGREGIDLTKLKGTTFGCNALYRDFYPTCLFAVDGRMVKEIEESEFPNERFWSKGRYSNALQWKGSNSGVVAFQHAINWGFGHIVIIGCDLKPDSKNEKTVNNLYTGSKNYPSPMAKAPTFQRWIKLYEDAMSKAKDYQQFTRIIHPEHSNPLESWERDYGVKNIMINEYIATLA